MAAYAEETAGHVVIGCLTVRKLVPSSSVRKHHQLGCSHPDDSELFRGGYRQTDTVAWSFVAGLTSCPESQQPTETPVSDIALGEPYSVPHPQIATVVFSGRHPPFQAMGT